MVGTEKAEQDSFLNNKTFYVCMLSLAISPIIVRKKIQELKLTTYVLFVGVICLIVLLTFLLILNGSYNYRIEENLITLPEIVED